MAKPLAAERVYETLFICPSDTPQKTIDGFIEKIKSVLEGSKGILKTVQVWGRRRLTYTVKHHRDALFIYIDFSGDKTAPEALKNLFRVTDFVLRAMTTDKVVLRPPYVRKPPMAEGAEAAAPTAAAVATATAPVATDETKAAPSGDKEA